MRDMFLTVLNMSLSASVVILAVLVARLLLRQAPKKWSYLLWSVVAFRLACPVSLESVFSIFRAAPVKPAVSQVSTVGQAPASAIQYIPQTVTTAPVTHVGALPTVPVVSPAVTTPAASGTVTHQVWLVAAIAAWVVGMATLLLYAVVSYLELKGSLATATRLEGNIYEADGIRSPFILGLFRPKIYIPYGLDSATLGYVLDHERYHIRRGDHIWKTLAYILLTVHWFNPLVWLAFHLMGRDMEMSCDEKVLGRGENIRREYSTTLLSFATERRFPAAAPLAFGETAVKTRIKNALNWKKPKTWMTLLAALLCIALVVSCAVNPTEERVDPTPGNSETKTTQELLDALEQNIAYGDSHILFRVPEGHSEADGWSVHISGRAAHDDGMTMSRHFLEDETLEPGQVYAIDPDGLSELTLTITLPDGEEKTIDLLALVPATTDPAPMETAPDRGLTIPIPQEYRELLDIEYTADSVSLYEKKSREEFRADYPNGFDGQSADSAGMGWLCTISRVDEAGARDALIAVDIGGTSFIGTDAQGNYYVYFSPTDVRCYRAGGVLSVDNMSQWEELTQWSWALPETFLAAHPELTAVTDEEARQALYVPSPYEGLEGLDLLNAVLSSLADENGARNTDVTLGLGGGETVRYYYGFDAPNGRGYAYGIVNNFTYTPIDFQQWPDNARYVSIYPNSHQWVLLFREDTDQVMVVGEQTYLYRATPKTEDVFSPNPYTLARGWYDEAEYLDLSVFADMTAISNREYGTYLEGAQAWSEMCEGYHLQVSSGSKYKWTYMKCIVEDAPENTQLARQRGEIDEFTWAFRLTTVFVPENEMARSWSMAGNTVEITGYPDMEARYPDAPEEAMVKWLCCYVTEGRDPDGWYGTIVGTSW